VSAPIAYYADGQDHLCIEGCAYPVAGWPYWILAYGTIGTCTASAADRCVAVDVRAITGPPERVVRHDGRERSTITLGLADGGTVRIALDTPVLDLEYAIRRALA